MKGGSERRREEGMKGGRVGKIKSLILCLQACT